MGIYHTVLAGWGNLGGWKGDREFYALRWGFATVLAGWGDLGGWKGDGEFYALRWGFATLGEGTDRRSDGRSDIRKFGHSDLNYPPVL